MLRIGIFAYDRMDQLDATGPFEVLAHVPDTEVGLYAPIAGVVRDYQGLRLAVEGSLEDAGRLDVLVLPGGPGQQELMDDQHVLEWLRTKSDQASYVLSVCTGALLLGAAGLLHGRRATTHWSAFDLLGCFGATAIDERVIIDGKWVFAAGVTAGIDGALSLAGLLRGAPLAQRVQLDLAYDPEPPFHAGSPALAAPTVLAAARTSGMELRRARERWARAYHARTVDAPGA